MRVNLQVPRRCLVSGTPFSASSSSPTTGRGGVCESKNINIDFPLRNPLRAISPLPVKCTSPTLVECIALFFLPLNAAIKPNSSKNWWTHDGL